MVVGTWFENTVFNSNGVMDHVSVTHFSKYLMIFSASLSAAKIFGVARDFSLWLECFRQEGSNIITIEVLQKFTDDCWGNIEIIQLRYLNNTREWHY
jgi:hypothetical protein